MIDSFSDSGCSPNGVDTGGNLTVGAESKGKEKLAMAWY